MIELAQITELCRSKDFDLVKINHQIDIAVIQSLLQTVMHDYTMVNKDGYLTYEAIGMQYADADNPLYDAVQQTSFINHSTVRKCRTPSRFTEPNEIGHQFGFVYEMFATHGIKLERGRVLKASAGHVHSEHLDYDIRIHLPVFTNPDCQMVYNGQHYHMPADGFLYLINGFRLHHFFNHGSQDRVHLVWLIQSELYK